LTLLATTACLAEPPASSKGDRTVTYETGDAKMDAAVADARRHLPRFWAAHASVPNPPEPMFAVKAALQMQGYDEGSNEHIWVGSLRRADGKVTGTLLNEPNDLGPELKKGSSVSFEESRISDWWILTPQGMLGAYTIRAMLDDLTPEEAAHEKSMLAEHPLPPGWR
jgi:uncharacterized protein YegJ (DUF2314 family)